MSTCQASGADSAYGPVRRTKLTRTGLRFTKRKGSIQAGLLTFGFWIEAVLSLVRHTEGGEPKLRSKARVNAAGLS
jgi:hypothetical protein